MDSVDPGAFAQELGNRLNYVRVFTPSESTSLFYERFGRLIEYLVDYFRDDEVAIVDVLKILSVSACTSIYVEKSKGDIQNTFSTFDEHCLGSHWSLQATQDFGVSVCNHSLVECLSKISHEIRHHNANFWSSEVANGARSATARTMLYTARGVIVRKTLYDVLVDPARSSEFWDYIIGIFEIIKAPLLPGSLRRELRSLIEIVSTIPEYRRMRDPNLLYRFQSLLPW